MPYSILGLDQMRRFKCLVDLDRNVLIFGGRDGVSVEFLPKEAASIAAYRMMYGESTQNGEVEEIEKNSWSRNLFGKK